MKKLGENCQVAILAKAGDAILLSAKLKMKPARYPPNRLKNSMENRVFWLILSSKMKPHLPVKRFRFKMQTPSRPKAKRNGPRGEPSFSKIKLPRLIRRLAARNF